MRQLLLNLEGLCYITKKKLFCFFEMLLCKMKINIISFNKKILKKQYIPMYIACFIFFIMAVVSTVVVVYDTNSHLTSYRKMQQLFLSVDYNLDKIRNKKQDVPRIFIKTLPSDFNMVESDEEKKELFIKFLLPLILKKNEELKARREELILIQNKILAKVTLTIEEELWLKNIKEEFKTKDGAIKDILVKLDEISVSMALGQAIQETGWGESRFLIQGNAIFAEWTWRGEGMVPRARKDGLIHRIKTFPTLYGSVESYAKNLNTTLYYAGFRRMRARLREQNKPLYGRWLMSSMVHYSTQKDVYILKIKKIIRDNSLDDFNNVKLAQTS